MRQLIVVAEMGTGGAESIVVQLAAAALARGDEVLVASAGGWRLDALVEAGAETVELPMRARGPLDALSGATGSVRRLRRALAGSPPVDVVHAHNVRATLVAGLALRSAGRSRGRRRGRGPGSGPERPLFVTTVHGLAPWHYRPAVPVLRAFADRVVAVSEEVSARLRAAGLPSDLVEVVPGAPEPTEGVDPERARAELGCPAGVPVVVCLARLRRPKRHDLLLEAWAGLVDPPLLLVAGDGPDRARLEERAAVLGLADRVRFLGDRRDVGRLLAASDVLVLPTDHEGLPVAVLEAMAQGVPVVASRVGGLRELAPDTLRLVAPGATAALAAAVVDVLGDTEATEAMVRRARGSVQASYTTTRMVRRYDEVFASPRRP